MRSPQARCGAVNGDGESVRETGPKEWRAKISELGLGRQKQASRSILPPDDQCHASRGGLSGPDHESPDSRFSVRTFGYRLGVYR